VPVCRELTLPVPRRPGDPLTAGANLYVRVSRAYRNTSNLTSPPKPTDAAQDRLILARALRTLRADSRLTQKDVAARAGTSEAYISHAETGRLDIRWHTLQRLLHALDADLHQLVDAIDHADADD
jgi:DNA-binding XRE family transcriptional regulator